MSGLLIKKSHFVKVISTGLLTGRFAVVLQDFTKDQLVGIFTEGITKHGSGNQVHVTVGALCLVGAGAIKVPLREICKRMRISYYTASVQGHRVQFSQPFQKIQESNTHLRCSWAQNQESLFCTGAPLLFHQSKCTWPGLYLPGGAPCTAA